MLDGEWLAGLDADGVCGVVERRHREVLAAEGELFFLAAHWADLHAGDGLAAERARHGGRVLPGMERSRRVGAHGTPEVAEFAAAELGALQGLGPVAAQCLVRDALNVRHRHGLLWAAVCAGRGRVWQARKVAQMCASAGLDAEQAGWVDAVTTPYWGLLPWGRFETLVAARIVEADPEAAEERRVAAAMARFVRTGQSSEYGLKTLVARATAGEVIFFVAMVDRIAQILATRGDTDPVQVRRSKAIGILATPARALRLLQEAAAEDEQTPNDTAAGDHDAADDEAAGAAGGDPEVVGEGDVHPAHNDADDPPPRPCPACRGAGQVSGDPAAFVKPVLDPTRVDPRRLLPAATLYVHITAGLLAPGARGVARCEGVGPLTDRQVVEFLGHTNVRVVPVLDLPGQEPVDGYEVPARMAEALHLRNPASVFPWDTNLSRRKDSDHVKPYQPPDRGGPPGQTAMGNLAGLGRFAHRLKTHGRWRLHQPRPGVFEWTSPHGHRYHVDHTGTHPLGRDPSPG